MSDHVLVCPSAPGRLDGVADYAAWLGHAFRAGGEATLVGIAAGAGATLVEPDLPPLPRVTVEGWQELWRRRREAPFASGIPMVQYVPQLYVRDASALWLLLWMVSARLGGRPVVVTVHEYAVPAARSLRRIAARLALPFAAVLAGAAASHVVATTGLTGARLQRWLFWKARRIAVVPVGSNIPVPASPGPRPVAPGRPVICVLFGQPAAMSLPALTAAGRWAASQSERVRLRWVGRSRREILDCWTGRCALPADHVEVIEGRPAAEVSAALADADLFLAPLADGVSSRRTTVAAALAHALPIVGTGGASTDAWLAGSPAFSLVAPGDGAGFAAAVEALSADSARRGRMGRAARELFDSRFSWDAIARAYERHLAI